MFEQTKQELNQLRFHQRCVESEQREINTIYNVMLGQHDYQKHPIPVWIDKHKRIPTTFGALFKLAPMHDIVSVREVHSKASDTPYPTEMDCDEIGDCICIVHARKGNTIKAGAGRGPTALHASLFGFRNAVRQLLERN